MVRQLGVGVARVISNHFTHPINGLIGAQLANQDVCSGSYCIKKSAVSFFNKNFSLGPGDPDFEFLDFLLF